MTDVAVIGAGPAGLSAAINARARGKSVLVVGNPMEENPLFKAPVVDNYPGLPGVSGAELLRRLTDHARESGAELRHGRVLNATPMGNRFFISIGSAIEEAGALIIAIGAQRGVKLPGEEALLGKGVSYCATCDGMLYRGKSVCVIGLYDGAEKEAAYLEEIGCNVRYIPRRDAVQVKILGEENVSALEVSGKQYACSGVFILRSSISPVTFLPDLQLEDGHIKVDKNMQTSVPGIFAAGDCVGKPYQINKAAGDGQKAALLAAELWLK